MATVHAPKITTTAQYPSVSDSRSALITLAPPANPDKAFACQGLRGGFLKSHGRAACGFERDSIMAAQVADTAATTNRITPPSSMTPLWAACSKSHNPGPDQHRSISRRARKPIVSGHPVLVEIRSHCAFTSL